MAEGLRSSIENEFAKWCAITQGDRQAAATLLLAQITASEAARIREQLELLTSATKRIAIAQSGG